jgi:hypothetical protein
MEQELRQMFEIKGAEMTVPPTLSHELRNRIGRQRMVTGGLVAAAAAALVLGGFAGARSLLSDDAAPVPPAEERKPAIEQMGNRRILHMDSGFWQGDTAPPPPGGRHTYTWDAFDQDTGSFLYVAQSIPRVWVVGADGLIAEFDCPPSSSCGANEMETFGPGPDEVTVPSADTSGPQRGRILHSRSVHVIGFDGKVRDTLDISVAVTQGPRLSDLAWSPDGSRLAISTESDDLDCDPCEGKVWILDRDGGDPQLVFTERTSEAVVLRDLAWSPDGDTLGLLVAYGGYGSGSSDPESAEQVWPRLVAVRMPSNQPVRAETLKVYDDWAPPEKVFVVPDDYHIAFPFAWSPDGTRIAVIGGGGITEISAENGEVLARHEAVGAEGPLAWLPKS